MVEVIVSCHEFDPPCRGDERLICRGSQPSRWREEGVPAQVSSSVDRVLDSHPDQMKRLLTCKPDVNRFLSFDEQRNHFASFYRWPIIGWICGSRLP
ncbi:hypothetical protein TNCV_3280491 [Trichonephila clavipes]|nr:hypothetical protein TNCV_3280491 [Trichonephila clavipes]